MPSLLLRSLALAALAGSACAGRAAVRSDCQEAVNACMARCAMHPGPDDEGKYRPQQGALAGPHATDEASDRCASRCLGSCNKEAAPDEPSDVPLAADPLHPPAPLEPDPENPLLPR